MASTSRAALGCEHYRCGCKIVCRQCDESFWCRFCHDEAQGHDHTFQRGELEQVECGSCRHRQPPPTTSPGRCRHCGELFGNYCCARCGVFDFDGSKAQWHCGACGICRVGGRHNFSHCSTCGYCIDARFQDSHQHKPDALGVTCLLCRSPEILGDSREGATVMVPAQGCGHAFHRSCLSDVFGELRSMCPICYLSENVQATDVELLFAQARELSFEAVGRSVQIPALPRWLSDLVLDSAGAARHRSGLAAYIERLADAVRPTEAEMAAGRAATQVVVLAAHQLRTVSVDRVCIGGSSGRKTNVRGDLDVDLVMLVNEQITQKLRAAAFKELADDLHYACPGRVRKVQLDPPVVLKLELEASGQWISLDISITQNLAGEVDGSKADAQRKAVLRNVLSRRPPEHRRNDDVGLCETMVAVTAAAPGQVNDAIHLVKCWAKWLHRNGYLPACEYPPLSVLLETMMLCVWYGLQRHAVRGTLRGVNAAMCLAAFLRLVPVIGGCQEELEVSQFYSTEEADDMREAWGPRGSPVVTHLVNPSNNMGPLIPSRGWQQLADRATALFSTLTNGKKGQWENSSLGLAVEAFSRECAVVQMSRMAYS